MLPLGRGAEERPRQLPSTRRPGLTRQRQEDPASPTGVPPRRKGLDEQRPLRGHRRHHRLPTGRRRHRPRRTSAPAPLTPRRPHGARATVGAQSGAFGGNDRSASGLRGAGRFAATHDRSSCCNNYPTGPAPAARIFAPGAPRLEPYRREPRENARGRRRLNDQESGRDMGECDREQEHCDVSLREAQPVGRRTATPPGGFRRGLVAEGGDLDSGD